MAGRLALLAAFLAFACAAQGETYKWVDEKGVTNYSNTPPAGKVTKKASQVEDRLSTVPGDPALRSAAAGAPSYYSQVIEAEWLQRQRLMAMKEASQPACPYPYSDCYEDPRASTLFPYPYVFPVMAPRPVFGRPAFHRHVLRTTGHRSMILR